MILGSDWFILKITNIWLVDRSWEQLRHLIQASDPARASSSSHWSPGSSASPGHCSAWFTVWTDVQLHPLQPHPDTTVSCPLPLRPEHTAGSSNRWVILFPVTMIVYPGAGSGKTIVAELAMFRVFRERPKAKVVYIAPLKVNTDIWLVNTKYSLWLI